MGNTLTCCLSPNASPKRGRRSGSAEPDYESEVYEAAAGDAVAVAPSPTALEPTELDFGAGEGHHLQHISDREMPEGEEVAGTVCSWAAAAPRVPREGAAASGSFLPGARFPRARHRPRRLALARRPHPCSFPVAASRLLPSSLPNARFSPLFLFPTATRDPPTLGPFCCGRYLTFRGTL